MPRGFDFTYEFFSDEEIPKEKDVLKRIERELWDVTRIMHVNGISIIRLIKKEDKK